MPDQKSGPLTKTAIRNLRHSQTEVLIAHVDREVPINRLAPWELPARYSLIKMGLLRSIPTGAKRPRATTLSEAGREAVCFILAQYADALMQAGLLEDDRVQALRDLLAAGLPSLIG